MAMQGISPSGEKKIIDIASIASGADTMTCMMGGRFCVFTIAGEEALSNSISITLSCGGEDSRYLPESANKTISISSTTGKIASIAVDMGGYQTFVVKSITGVPQGKGKLIIEPMWC
jgi:hypothetical protein